MNFLHIGLLSILLLLTGCASTKRLPPPPEIVTLADIPGMPRCRYWGDDEGPNAAEISKKTRTQITSQPGYRPDAPVHFLAISGGGQEGAFCAGLLAGWSASGERPEFQCVTGVSSGALLAPFAFLGSEYDYVSQELFSKYSTKDIINKRIFSALFSGKSLASNKPLKAVLMSYLTPSVMEEIAKQHARGRRLFVSSTHLDSQRPVIWDLGAIASSGHPGAYDVLINAILASSAFPGVFPPLLVEVEQNGKIYEEMHVDGGLTGQVFITPYNYDIAAALDRLGLHGPAHVYVIRNGTLWPEVTEVKPRNVPILIQTADTFVRSMTFNGMYHIYQDTQKYGLEFYAAYLPVSFRDNPDEPFDKRYMKELFDLAYDSANEGYAWDRKPPEFADRKNWDTSAQ